MRNAAVAVPAAVIMALAAALAPVPGAAARADAAVPRDEPVEVGAPVATVARPVKQTEQTQQTQETQQEQQAQNAQHTKRTAKKKRAKTKRSRALRMGFSVPKRIRIPSIGVNAPLVKIDVDRRGRLQVPPLSRPGVAGWYVGSASPGQIGPAVVVGHMDTRTGPAVFFRLRRLKPGARIYIDRRDGSTAVFEARKRIRVPKTRFPTDAVYGDIGNAGLRLITCGGAFDHRTRHYRDNIIVFARLVRAINHRSA